MGRDCDGDEESNEGMIPVLPDCFEVDDLMEFYMNVQCQNCHSSYNVDPSKIPPAGARFKCKNCGSIVEVKLPDVAEEVTSMPEKGPAKTDSKDGKKRIVVADDTAFFRMMLSDLLTEAGYEVITAVDGEDALIKIKHELPDLDLVLLDMLMPKMDGFKVIEELNKGVMGRNLPVLALSGVFKSDTDRDHMKKLGVLGYVDKDTSPDQILERVNMILHR